MKIRKNCRTEKESDRKVMKNYIRREFTVREMKNRKKQAREMKRKKNDEEKNKRTEERELKRRAR